MSALPKTSYIESRRIFRILERFNQLIGNMARPELDIEKVAEVVIDAALLGDKMAATKHGLSSRSIRRYRSEHLADNEFLVEAIRSRVSAFVRLKWELRLDMEMTSTLDRFAASFDKAMQIDPVAAAKLASQHFENVATVNWMFQILKVRVAELSGETRSDYFEI